jgi:hypothetical protein
MSGLLSPLGPASAGIQGARKRLADQTNLHPTHRPVARSKQAREAGWSDQPPPQGTASSKLFVVYNSSFINVPPDTDFATDSLVAVSRSQCQGGRISMLPLSLQHNNRPPPVKICNPSVWSGWPFSYQTIHTQYKEDYHTQSRNICMYLPQSGSIW